MRKDGRLPNQLRPISFETHFSQWAEGSVLARFGQTHVLCNVTIENTLPDWLKNKGIPQGWITAEYAMLPRSTHRRTPREQRWPKGRTQEISRLIGRSLRMAVDLKALGERTITIDCDVLQADGGTRTAAITGSWVALQLALRPFIERGDIPTHTLTQQVAAISLGVVAGVPMLDLAYNEDVEAETDINVVMNRAGQFIEIQGTAEKNPITRETLNTLLDMATQGINQLFTLQQQAIV